MRGNVIETVMGAVVIIVAALFLKRARARQAAYRTVTIQLQNEDHTQVVQTWKLLRARIVKHVSGPLNAKGCDVAMEELTLAYERLEME